jgi:hypothetical protein
MSLNVKSPYRRQKRDLSIIRSSFRRPHTRIEIPATKIITFLPTTSPTSYLPTFLRPHRPLPTFLPSCDHIDHFLPSYLLATTSTTSYLLTFLRSHRLLPNFLPSYLLATIPTTKQPILTQPIKTALDLPCPGMVNNQLIRSALDFYDPRHGKSPTNQNTRDQ